MAETPQSAEESAAPASESRLPRAFEGPLGKLLKECRRAFWFVFLLTLVIDTLQLAPIIYIWNMYDRVLLSRSITTLFSLLMIVAFVYVFWLALEWVRTQVMIRISLRIDWELAASVFDAAFRRVLLQRKINTHQVLGDMLKVRQFLTGEPILALMTTPLGIIFIAAAFMFHTYMGMFLIFSTLIMVWAAFMTKQLSSPILKAANDVNSEANRIAAQLLRNSETAFALGMQTNIRRRWLERHQSFLELQVNASEASGALGGIVGFLGRMLPSLKIALMVWLAISAEITGGMVIAGIFLLRRALGPLETVLRTWPDIAAARESYRNLNRLLMEDQLYAERMALPAPTGQLRVKDLTVKPPRAKEAVLHEITFSLDPGEAMAVLGPSASGKSTLARALVGIWPPEAGAVRLDGAEVSQWVRGDLGQHMGYVPQEFEFFEGTVAENVARMGEIDPERVVEATRLVGLHSMVLSFPSGYETKLGEQRHPLTGGQKQRLALARALYGDPKFLVLDEPDSSLDENGQRALIRALREAKKGGASMVFTTHRPEMLELADKVVVLDEGRIRWAGSGAEFKASLAKQDQGRVARLASDGS